MRGDRDHNGLRKGEKTSARWRQRTSALGTGRRECAGVKISDTPTGKQYVAKESIPLFILTQSARRKPRPSFLRCRCSAGCLGISKAKARNATFAAARSCAIWPDATDEQLCAEPDVLKAALLARLPALMQGIQGGR